jgi:hypothetical protein
MEAGMSFGSPTWRASRWGDLIPFDLYNRRDKLSISWTHELLLRVAAPHGIAPEEIPDACPMDVIAPTSGWGITPVRVEVLRPQSGSDPTPSKETR